MKDSSQDEQPYPWYDSFWLTRYQRAKDVIRRVQPEKLPVFVTALSGLRTGTDFRIKKISGLFDDATMATIRQTITTFQLTELELHELKKFGRFVVHDHPFFTGLQKKVIDLVSEATGEPVEASYNFVSLYKKVGVCAVHMDAPQAKWTLDLCIEQSAPWPIHFSQVVPWPEDITLKEDDWQSAIKESPDYEFTSYSLEPGEAVIFSGSSQWHYRDPLQLAGKEHFCTLVFFHFVPKGMLEIVRPENWARLFGIPELADV
jgi:hypothetical protein